MGGREKKSRGGEEGKKEEEAASKTEPLRRREKTGAHSVPSQVPDALWSPGSSPVGSFLS